MTTSVRNPSFPREFAQTQNYALGAPRTFRVSEDGTRVFYLRSECATEKRLDLWYINASQRGHADPRERLLVPFKRLAGTAVRDNLDPQAELTRRERLREAAGGITAY